MVIIPPKLKQGDEIRVISPSRSLSIVSPKVIEIATERLKKLGFKITFSKHIKERDEFDSSSIDSRIEDIQEAFLDKKVKAILTAIGGFNSNQLLKYLDYNLIKLNPKILCGYSDITALQNTIYTKTGLVTYSGPHFSTFGMLKGVEYTVECFRKCLMEEKLFEIKPSEFWSDDSWYEDQENRKFIKNKGYLVINEGEAEGTLIGGNLSILNLLQETEFIPPLEDMILFIEDDKEVNSVTFDRGLEALINLPEFDEIKAILIGRFQKASKIRDDLLFKIIRSKRELKNIPVIAQIDFGHTTPQVTLPIGGRVKIIGKKNKIQLKILIH